MKIFKLLQELYLELENFNSNEEKWEKRWQIKEKRRRDQPIPIYTTCAELADFLRWRRESWGPKGENCLFFLNDFIEGYRDHITSESKKTKKSAAAVTNAERSKAGGAA